LRAVIRITQTLDGSDERPSFLLSFFFDPLIGIPAENFARLKPTVFQNSLWNASAVCHNPY
jgi:hypothetical protein